MEIPTEIMELENDVSAFGQKLQGLTVDSKMTLLNALICATIDDLEDIMAFHVYSVVFHVRELAIKGHEKDLLEEVIERIKKVHENG